ncbi:hypothetical protein [Occultella gossypii]|uniref:Uncharacterized protein n=1 Tax=Occultella gossypii TaxID=2800820 RepID=A0ABS7S9P6_9MICO|nr:hypothetical protein [Occultella gossypii]MBZ2195968.1 hypothetical protein [Occultella gossypii]
MEPSTWIAIASAVVALVALFFTAIAASAAKRQADAAVAQTEVQRAQADAAIAQTQLQQELARQSQQPYVWADILPDMQQGTTLQLVVGNAGPTLATNVRVTVDRPLPSVGRTAEWVTRVQERLADGIKSLSPGRTIHWALGTGPELLKDDGSQTYHIVVEADGPSGPLDRVEHDVDVSDWREARDAPDGSLHHVRGSIKDLNKTVDELGKKLLAR